MRSLLVVVVAFFSLNVFAGSKSFDNAFGDQILGIWQFYQVFYNGQKRPPFNPELKLFFQFGEDQQSRIFYYRANESGFCERKGHFYIDGEILVDRVTWVNPKNNIGCGQDPDMRMGNETRTKIDIQDGDFHLYLSLKGEPLVYIWKSVEEIPPHTVIQ